MNNLSQSVDICLWTVWVHCEGKHELHWLGDFVEETCVDRQRMPAGMHGVSARADLHFRWISQLLCGTCICSSKAKTTVSVTFVVILLQVLQRAKSIRLCKVQAVQACPALGQAQPLKCRWLVVQASHATSSRRERLGMPLWNNVLQLSPTCRPRQLWAQHGTRGLCAEASHSATQSCTSWLDVSANQMLYLCKAPIQINIVSEDGVTRLQRHEPLNCWQSNKSVHRIRQIQVGIVGVFGLSHQLCWVVLDEWSKVAKPRISPGISRPPWDKMQALASSRGSHWKHPGTGWNRRKLNWTLPKPSEIILSKTLRRFVQYFLLMLSAYACVCLLVIQLPSVSPPTIKRWLQGRLMYTLGGWPDTTCVPPPAK